MHTQKRVFISLAIIGFAVISACAILVPPPELVASNNHARLAVWYEEEAEHLRAHAEEIREMAKQYEYLQFSAVIGLGRHEMASNLKRMNDNYTNAAKEADQLAAAHRAMSQE